MIANWLPLFGVGQVLRTFSVNKDRLCSNALGVHFLLTKSVYFALVILDFLSSFVWIFPYLKFVILLCYYTCVLLYPYIKDNRFIPFYQFFAALLRHAVDKGPLSRVVRRM